MMASILGKGPYINEAMAVAESTMTCLMGREAAYSGQKVTWDMMMNSQAGPAAEVLRLQRQGAGAAAAGPGRLQVRLAVS